MYVVSYEIIGAADAPETGTASAFELEDAAASSGTVPTVRALREGFPYEGHFHFRAKVPCPPHTAANEGDDGVYAWLDLTDADAPLPVWRKEGGQEHVHVRVLPLALPALPAGGDDTAVAAGTDGVTVQGETLDYSGGDLDDDILEASYGQGSEDQQQPHQPYDYHQSAHRRRQGSGGSDGGGATWSQSLKEATETVLTSEITRDVTKLGKQVGKQVGKGVNRLFKAVLSAAAGEPGAGGGSGGGYPGATPAPPSHAAVKTLHALEQAVTRVPSVDLLVALWQALFPAAAEPFAPRSPQWRAAGFTGDDPLVDLRGSGALCVQCILSFARQHPRRLHAILTRDQAHYPFAAMANSLALMLVDVFKLRNGRYLNVQAGFWGLFEGGRGAGALEEVFAACLVHLDRRWAEVETGATWDALIQPTRRRVEHVLGQGPASLEEFADLFD